jgi:hypothetical protein
VTRDAGRLEAKTADDQPKGWPSVVVGTGVDPVTFRFSGRPGSEAMCCGRTGCGMLSV